MTYIKVERTVERMGDAKEMLKLSYALSKKVFFTFVNIYFIINKKPLKTN